MKITELKVPGYERVVRGEDEDADYRGFVFVHSSALGPAVGGTRYWSYPNDEAAITDGLRLSRGMTYKNALAELPCGGGKSIIMRQPGKENREALFRSHGRLVESLHGKYVTAEDVGTSPADMEFVLLETRHVAGLQGASGDPSPHTARGVFRAMQAAARHRWENDDLRGKRVALQGCGHVGYSLAGELTRAGALVIASDVDEGKLQRVINDFGAARASVDEIHRIAADVFSPCALGSILNDATIPQLKADLVVGGANNQLLEARHGEVLAERGILYAPDYAANAGGVINGTCRELLGWDSGRTAAKVDAIYETLLKIFHLAEEQRVPTSVAADRMVEEKLNLHVS
jgi:leucine dehydrogenase